MRANAENNFFGGRLKKTKFLIFFCLSLLIVRLWFLQCFNGSFFRDLSENNRTRTVRTTAPRGNILDREDKIIVRNRPSFSVALMLEDIHDVDNTIEELAKISGRSPQLLKNELGSNKKRHHFEPQEVMSDVSWQELARIKVNSFRLPGVIVNANPVRSYPFNSLLAQLLGYVREISKTQLESDKGKRYRLGDVIGQNGLEKQWNEELKGKNGYVQVEVDAMGNRRQELGIINYSRGKDVYLTIDLDLQLAAEKALAGYTGAVVALDPRDGSVLAIASSPTFDPNIFAGNISPSDWESLTHDKSLPLSNRALTGAYPPGSTIKLLMAVAGLAEKKITPETIFDCPGYYLFAGRRYHCHKHGGHGRINLRQAVTMSCNAYFFQLGQLNGLENISKYARLFGLGEPTGIDVPGEISGIVPSAEWKRRIIGEKWYPGDTLPVSIGQGYLTVTPLQMAVYISTIANEGKVFQPHIVRKIVDPATGQATEFSAKLVRSLEIDQNIFKQVKSFAVDVVNSEKGTGAKARIDGITVAGKTGTAQASGATQGDHSWFVSFAPAENPTIAMAVIAEHAGHGGTIAAPITKEVMKIYFEKQGLIQTEGTIVQEPIQNESSEEEEGSYLEESLEPVKAN